ncbi:hypothetical protein POM88_031373 [Heracleum sosnowskyi]|uniref:Condensin complex subunit 1 C-terminal domain-containing protein n=1 Tax=Heracleum sosnowskyi TaxID=360622 RepID=A0AAD8MGK2_9APIA|nr:hypothetical protein POM88_031373 [Heracleum sosnowskyi]
MGQRSCFVSLYSGVIGEHCGKRQACFFYLLLTLHTAVDLVNETKLDTKIISWLAFAAQKVVEVNALAKALCGSKDEVDSEYCCFDHLQEVLYLVPEVIKSVFQNKTSEVFKIKEFSEWSQCIVLELVSKYVPPDNSEFFDIMNLLEDRLQHANGAVVLATIKLSRTDVHQQLHNLIFLVHHSSLHMH